jgi:hypothetical protein
MFQNAMKSIERKVFGSNHFVCEARATRALVGFCVDHGYPAGTIQDLGACLAALEAGERSNAVAAFKRVPMGKDGLCDWFPTPISPTETGDYTLGVFEALVERWYRLMSSMAERP